MMEKYISIYYRLCDVTDGQNELIEEFSKDYPYHCILGIGELLDEFERQISEIEAGHEFDITLRPEQAYREYSNEKVVEIEKETFVVDGAFDSENVYEDAVIPLRDEDGNYLKGIVMEVRDNSVIVNLNHPLAGRVLNFHGGVIENREASNKDVNNIIEEYDCVGNHCNCNCNCEDNNSKHQGECRCRHRRRE